MQSVQLFTAALCPFAHRARLVLAEKGVEAHLIEIDPRNKPPEFLRIAPQGEVPLLRHEGHLLWESSVISEYLEDAFPEPALLPAEPGARGRARIWVQFADSRLYAHTRALLYAREPSAQQQILPLIAQDLQFMEREGLARRETGPYWLGPRFSIVDATIYPWFEQLAVLERYRNFTWPEGCERLLEWCDVVARRSAVQTESRSADFYVGRYQAFLS